MRTYFLEDPVHPNGGITVGCKDDHDCVFCDHCTDVFWDYTNLIYMILCDENHDPRDRPCKYFVEGGTEARDSIRQHSQRTGGKPMLVQTIVKEMKIDETDRQGHAD